MCSSVPGDAYYPVISLVSSTEKDCWKPDKPLTLLYSCMEFGCSVLLCFFARMAIPAIITIVNCSEGTSAWIGVYSLALNMCYGGLLKIENLSGIKRACGCSFLAQNCICAFSKTKWQKDVICWAICPFIANGYCNNLAGDIATVSCHIVS